MTLTTLNHRARHSLAALLLAGSLVPAFAAPATAAAGATELIAAANAKRTDAGLAPVSAHAVLNVIAAERAQQQADDRRLSHDFDYVMARLDQEGVCWQQFGEILAWNGSGSAADFISQWMNSDPHRKIMLGSGYNVAGGAWALGSDGHWYAAMLFMKSCGTAAAPTTSSFTDIGSSPFYGDIEWLVDQGITSGCSTTRFCPTAAVTRAQMASFLVRALDLPATSRDYFRDDETSPHEADINRLAAAGIASGCDTGRFCPGAKVSREQMASFLSRALALGSASRDYFGDDERSMHEVNINRVAAAAITGGCATARYCPTSTVTREQMAAFLHRAFS